MDLNSLIFHVFPMETNHQITQILVDWYLYHSSFSSLALGGQIIIFFFKTHFDNKNSNKISAMDVGSFFGRFWRL
jgi:hypothetical protein